MPPLELPEDFRDLLVALVDAGADFMLIGGRAMAVHGRPRATEDIDVLVRPTAANSAKVFAALAAFGAPVGPHGVDANTFGSEGPAYRIGVKPLRYLVVTMPISERLRPVAVGRGRAWDRRRRAPRPVRSRPPA